MTDTDENHNREATEEQRLRDAAVAKLNEEQTKRLERQTYLWEEERGVPATARLQTHLATIIAKDLPPVAEYRDIELAVRREHNLPPERSAKPEPSVAEPAQIKGDEPAPRISSPISSRDYSELQRTHDQVASELRSDEARTNDEGPTRPTRGPAPGRNAAVQSAAGRDEDTRDGTSTNDPARRVQLQDQQKQTDTQEAVRTGKSLTGDQRAGASPETQQAADRKEKEAGSSLGRSARERREAEFQRFVEKDSGNDRGGRSGR